jgi:hypothetical protein
MAGMATTLTSWNAGIARLTAPHRATFTRLARGATLGRPHDAEQQRCVLEATLDLLALDAPLEPVSLNRVCA